MVNATQRIPGAPWRGLRRPEEGPVTWSTSLLRNLGATAAVYAPLPLRAILALGFLVHGLPKIFSVPMHQQFSAALQSMRVPAPEFMAWLVGFVEVLGGLALLFGLVTALASAVLIVEQVVAMLLVHAKNGFDAIHIVGQGPNGPIFGMPGVELNLFYIAGLLALLLAGAGALSLDEYWERRQLGRIESKTPV